VGSLSALGRSYPRVGSDFRLFAKQKSEREQNMKGRGAHLYWKSLGPSSESNRVSSVIISQSNVSSLDVGRMP